MVNIFRQNRIEFVLFAVWKSKWIFSSGTISPICCWNLFGCSNSIHGVVYKSRVKSKGISHVGAFRNN